MNVMNEIIRRFPPGARAPDPPPWWGGSQLHGVKTEGTDDHDIYGIYVEAPECCFWEACPHFRSPPRRRRGRSERNKAGDVECHLLFNCEKFARFARLPATTNTSPCHCCFTRGRRRMDECPLGPDPCIQRLVLCQRSCACKIQRAKMLDAKYRGGERRMTGDRGRGKQRPTPGAGREVLLRREGPDATSSAFSRGIGWSAGAGFTLAAFFRPSPTKQIDRGTSREWSEDRIIAEANRLMAELGCRRPESFTPASAAVRS